MSECDACGRRFRNIFALDAHTKAIHPSAPPILDDNDKYCDRCRQSFRSFTKFWNHLSSKHPDTYCSHCRSDIASPSRLLKHIASEHPDVYCIHCRTAFRNWNARHQHFLREHADTYCKPCRQDFPNVARRNRHNAEVHADSYCARCAISLVTRVELERHLTTNHRETHCFHCLFNNNFNTVAELLRHYGERHADSYCRQCHECVLSLPEHLQSIHPDTSCVRCVRNFDGVSELRGHFLECHADTYCRWCRGNFESSDMLREHLEDAHPDHSDAISTILADQIQISQPNSSAGHVCPICLELKENLSNVKCGHAFCTPCIRRALTEKRECPKCRLYADLGDLRRIFF